MEIILIGSCRIMKLSSSCKYNDREDKATSPENKTRGEYCLQLVTMVTMVTMVTIGYYGYYGFYGYNGYYWLLWLQLVTMVTLRLQMYVPASM